MFHNNAWRPSAVGAGNSNVKNGRSFDHISFSANSGNTDFDFDSRGSGSTNSTNEKKHAPGPKIGSIQFTSKKSFAAVIAVIAAIVIAIVAVICYFALKNPNITYEDNAYLVYVDANGKYKVIANGTVLDQEFEGEIELVAADDNSFAYVFDDTGDGYVMYLIEGKDCKVLIDGEAVEEWLTVATLSPGIVYETERDCMLYSKKEGIEQLEKLSNDPDNFVISGDAKTVFYTANNKLYRYNDRSSEPIAKSKGAIPVAVSNYGDYAYLTEYNGKDSLYVYETKSQNIFAINDSKGFISILDMNIKGNEVIFCTASTSNADETGILNVKTYLYRFDAKTDESVIKLGKGIVMPAVIDPTVAVYDTYADTYFTTITSLDLADLSDSFSGATYYLSKKFELDTIHGEHNGKFDANGDYFYYIDDGALIRMDLDSKTRDTKEIYDGVSDFVITEKGNVYFLSDDDDDSKYLMHYKASNGAKNKTSTSATKFSFYNYANKIYFSEDGRTDVFSSEEGSEKDITKLGSKPIANLPHFTNPNGKKSYAIVYNGESYAVYYTSNGSKFKLLKDANDCAEFFDANGNEMDLSDYIIG